MLSYTDLKKGVQFVRDGEPCEVLEANFSRMQQRKAVVQAKIRNLRTGKTLDTTFQPSDQFEDAMIEKRPFSFLYEHRGEFVFTDPADKKKRLTLSAERVGDSAKWLMPNTSVEALFFNDELLSFKLPVKLDLTVTEAPPGVQGDRAQSGNKAVTLETGTIVQVPLFINTGDIIRINTETGDYVERVKKV
ncbi:MAG: elongation factor P [bacterium]|nr:elongation factor P [bacterium]